MTNILCSALQYKPVFCPIRASSASNYYVSHREGGGRGRLRERAACVAAHQRCRHDCRVAWSLVETLQSAAPTQRDEMELGENDERKERVAGWMGGDRNYGSNCPKDECSSSDIGRRGLGFR